MDFSIATIIKEYKDFLLSRGKYKSSFGSIYLCSLLSRLLIYIWCIYNIVNGNKIRAILFFVLSLYLLFMNCLTFFNLFIAKNLIDKLEKHEKDIK